jgi:hypothetical protein
MKSRAISSLIAKVTSSGIWVSDRRARSSAQAADRYGCRSIRVCLNRLAGEKHAEAVLNPSCRARVLVGDPNRMLSLLEARLIDD